MPVTVFIPAPVTVTVWSGLVLVIVTVPPATLVLIPVPAAIACTGAIFVTATDCVPQGSVISRLPVLTVTLVLHSFVGSLSSDKGVVTVKLG